MASARGSVILIVIERPEQRVLFNQHLRSSPYHLVFATDGEDGFDRFLEIKPDLVIAHLSAHRLDGTILCQLMRQQPGGRLLPIVLMSEDLKGDPQAQKRCQTVGADAALPLPCTKDELLRTIEEALLCAAREPHTDRGRQAAAEAPAARQPAFDDDEQTQEGEAGPPVALRSRRSGFFLPAIESGDDDIPTSSAELAPNFEELGLGQRPGSDPATTPTMTAFAKLELAGADVLLEEPPLPAHHVGVPSDLSRKDAPAPFGGDAANLERSGEDTAGDASSPGDGREGSGGRVQNGLDESQLGRRLIERVHQVHRLLAELDHYQLLGLETGATIEQVRAHYFELSLEFHPDRFFLLRSGQVKSEIYAIFRQVNEAYAVLSDPERRARYDAERAKVPVLVAPPIPDPAVTRPPGGRLRDVAVTEPEARRFLQEAETAFQLEAYEDARLFVALALAYEPANPQLRALFEAISKGRGRFDLPAWSPV